MSKIFCAALALLLCSIVCPENVFGQELEKSDRKAVSGVIVESVKGKSKPLSLCKVQFSYPNGSRAARTLTLDDGKFRVLLPAGSYKVKIENTGHRSRSFDVNVSTENIDLGVIVLEIGEEIGAASVEASSLIRRHGTRLVYDVSKDPDASKISMTEMASRIPALKMASRNGQLEFEHQRFQAILVDNAESGLINVHRQYPMEFIKADHMKSIEIVMPGDLEYHNEQPIMLITLARPLPYGFASNIQLTSDTKNNHSPSLDMVANTPLIGVGFGYDFQFSGAPALTDETTREATGDESDIRKIESKTSSRQWSDAHSMKMNVFRSFAGETINVNASLNAMVSDSRSSVQSQTGVFDADGLALSEGQTITSAHTQSPFRLNGGLRVRGSFGKPLTKTLKKNRWSVSYTLNNTRQDTRTDYSGLGLQLSSNGTLEHKVQATLDMRNMSVGPLSASFSTKGGYYNRRYRSNSSYLEDIEGLDYTQQVSFLNLSILGSALDNKLGFILLLNSEYLNNKGSFVNGSTVSPLDYSDFNLNPNLSLSWHFKRGGISVSWLRTVKRPGIRHMNPYIDRSNPFLIKTGNPELKGAETDQYSFSYHVSPSVKWIRRASITASYTTTKNDISRIVLTNADGSATSTYANLGARHGVGFSGVIDVAPRRDLSFMAMATYSRNKVVMPGGLENEFSSFISTASVSWNPRWFELICVIRLAPSTSSVQTRQFILEPYGELSIARYFEKPHLGVALIMADAFHSGGFKQSSIQGAGFVQYNSVERTGRHIIARVYWRFGRFKPSETVNIKAYDM
ncbi:MAG: outer membrane beta-barrel protein [Bacteroidales bacterium]|nr:outer membrane beta-barrel protein [Bacteroidales bacterium]